MGWIVVNQSSNPFHNTHDTGWHILGDLEMPAGLDWVEELDSWMVSMLQPLKLNADFLGKLLFSAQDAAASAIQPAKGVKLDRIHLIIYAQKKKGLRGETWGFFRIVNIYNAQSGLSSLGQNIEFYLYIEG